MGVQKSGWHQGKGSRRMPIFRSAGRKKWQEWEKQAAHQVARIELSPPLAEIVYQSPAGKTGSAAIYLFDQEAARYRLAYSVESITGNQRYGYDFKMLISQIKLQVAVQITAKINRRPISGRKWWTSRCGYWSDLIESHNKDFKGWCIATYREQSSERTDKQDYLAVLFRDKQRTKFGIQEYFGDAAAYSNWTNFRLREVVKKINDDCAFRNQLLSDDLDLPKMWRYH